MHEQRRRESRGRSQSQLALDSNGDISGDLYYNSRPPESRRQVSTVFSLTIICLPKNNSLHYKTYIIL